MPRYIDAERFSERFDMMCDAGGVLAPVTEAVREMVKKLIKAEPTADMQEVRHGRWIDGYPEDYERGITAQFKCSECGRRAGISQTRTYRFCPKCGAKMDGGENNETDVRGDVKAPQDAR